MDKFASSIEDINGKFEAHTKERATLVEENEESVRAPGGRARVCTGHTHTTL